MCTKLQFCSAWQTKQNHGPVWPEPVLSNSTCYTKNGTKILGVGQHVDNTNVHLQN